MQLWANRLVIRYFLWKYSEDHAVYYRQSTELVGGVQMQVTTLTAHPPISGFIILYIILTIQKDQEDIIINIININIIPYYFYTKPSLPPPVPNVFG